MVTGFEKFGKHIANPTEQLVERISRQVFKGSQVETLILPVSYKRSFQLLHSKIQQMQPDYVLCLGLAGDRDYIGLERIAINIESASISDNDGDLAIERSIFVDQPEGVFSNLPLISLRNHLVDAGYNVKISNTAGTYVCNSIMFKTLVDAKKYSYKAGFIHFPHTQDTATATEKASSYTLDDYEAVLSKIIEKLCEQ